MNEAMDTVLCLFMEGFPENVDPANQCWNNAEWHIRYVDGDQFDGVMTSACESHLGRALGWREVLEFHKFGSACNTIDSWWLGDTCVTTETALEMGEIAYCDPDDPNVKFVWNGEVWEDAPSGTAEAARS